MIYTEPMLGDDDRAVIKLISEQRQRLALQTQNNPRRWTGSIRRRTFAKAIQGSNSIEGYNASVDEAIGVIEDEPIDERTETWYALTGYRTALTYIMQAARDPDFEFNKQLLKSLHFIMIGYDMSKNPGQWRPGPFGLLVREQTRGSTRLLTATRLSRSFENYVATSKAMASRT